MRWGLRSGYFLSFALLGILLSIGFILFQENRMLLFISWMFIVILVYLLILILRGSRKWGIFLPLLAMLVGVIASKQDSMIVSLLGVIIYLTAAFFFCFTKKPNNVQA